MAGKHGQGRWPARPAGTTRAPATPKVQPPGVQRETGAPPGGRRHGGRVADMRRVLPAAAVQNASTAKTQK
jgi:hypothetical protein